MSASTPTSAAYIPPHLSSSHQPRNGSIADSRYSKEQLLNIFKTQRDSGTLGKNMGDHFLAAWNPLEDSSSTNGAWGKREDQKDPSSGPEVCWDHLGQHGPLGLTELNDEEREVSRLSFELPHVLLIVYTAVYNHCQFPAQAPALKCFQGQYWPSYWAQVVHIAC